MAIGKKIQRMHAVEAEALLPWYATGTLGARDARQLIVALARDPELAEEYAAVREEYAETIRLNESLGAPSPRAMQNLFAAIDAESCHFPGAVTQKHSPFSPAALKGFLVSLSPKTLAWSAALAMVALLMIGSAFGALLMKYEIALQH